MFNSMILKSKNKIKSFFNNSKKSSKTLLDDLSSAIILAEQDFKEITITLNEKIQKEHLFDNLINILEILINCKLDSPLLDNALFDTMKLLNAHDANLIKFQNNKFKCIKSVSVSKEKLDFKKDLNYFLRKDFVSNGLVGTVGFFKCYESENLKLYVFPIIVRGELWGVFNFLLDNNCDINNIYFCYILTTLLASHIKTRKLINELNQYQRYAFV